MTGAIHPIPTLARVNCPTGSALTTTGMLTRASITMGGCSVAFDVSRDVQPRLPVDMRQAACDTLSVATRTAAGSNSHSAAAAFVSIGSVALIAWRGDTLRAPGRIDSPVSREAAFLVNNLLFAALAVVVLLGTVYPLLAEALQGRQLSVGEPYFDRMTTPIGIALLFLMAVGPALPWRAARGELGIDGKAVPVSFAPPTRSHVLVQHDAGAPELDGTPTGRRGDGVARVSGGGRAVSVAVPWFREEYPKALTVSADGIAVDLAAATRR